MNELQRMKLAYELVRSAIYYAGELDQEELLKIAEAVAENQKIEWHKYLPSTFDIYQNTAAEVKSCTT